MVTPTTPAGTPTVMLNIYAPKRVRVWIMAWPGDGFEECEVDSVVGERPEWLDSLVDWIGWEHIMDCPRDDEGVMAWLLLHGIVPDQPFCVEVFEYRSWINRDNEGDEDWEWDIVTVPPISTDDAVDALNRWIASGYSSKPAEAFRKPQEEQRS